MKYMVSNFPFSSVYLHMLITLFMATDGWLCLCKVYIHLADCIMQISLSLSLSLSLSPSLSLSLLRARPRSSVCLYT